MGKRKSIVIVAEGALDRNLKPIKADYIKDVLTDRLGLDTRVTTLGHTQRGGVPCAFDRILATLQGVEAVNAVLEATPETPSYVIGIVQNKIVRNPLEKAVELVRPLLLSRIRVLKMMHGSPDVLCPLSFLRCPDASRRRRHRGARLQEGAVAPGRRVYRHARRV